MRVSEPRIIYDACPLCESTAILEHKISRCDHHPLYHDALPGEIRWMRCTSCTHSFTDGYWSAEALSHLFASANPNQMPGSNPHGSRAVSARMVEKVIRHLDKPEGRWLDIGFGNGALLGTAEEYGFSPVGLDLRERPVELMRLDGIEAHVMEFEDYRPEQPLNVISMADVLEHLPFPGTALRHAHQILAPHGLLLLSMPNSDCYAWRMLDRLNANPYWGELEHYHNFGKQRLYALLEEHGFEPLSYGISERYYLCMEVIAHKRS